MRPIVVNKHKPSKMIQSLRVREGILEAIHNNLKLAVEKYQKALKSVNVTNYIDRIKEEVMIPVVYDYDKFMTQIFPKLLDNYSEVLFKDGKMDILKGFTQFDDKFYPKQSYYENCKFFTYKSISFDKYEFAKDLVENIFGIPSTEQSIYLSLAMALFTDFIGNLGIDKGKVFELDDLNNISQSWGIIGSRFVTYNNSNVYIEFSYIRDYIEYIFRDNGTLKKKASEPFSLYWTIQGNFQFKVYKGDLYLTLPLSGLVSSIYHNDVLFDGYFQSNKRYLNPDTINKINDINKKLAIPKEYNPLDIEDKEQRFEAIVKGYEILFRRLFNV